MNTDTPPVPPDQDPSRRPGAEESSAKGDGASRLVGRLKALVRREEASRGVGAPVAPKSRRDGEAPSDTVSHKALFRSFLLCVVLPTLIALLHITFISSDVYVSEVKLTVREGGDVEVMSAASSIFSKIGFSKPSGTAQDSLVILDYIKSRAIIEDMGGRKKLAYFFDRDGIDYLSRLDSTKSIEKIWEYWQSHITASVDTQSNVLTLRVKAYSAADAKALAEEIVTCSEALVNSLSVRSRKDALDRARIEVDRSAQTLAGIRTDVLDFQQKTKSINPIDTAKRIASIISTLTLQRIELDSQLTTSAALGVRGGPGERQLQTRLGIIDKQIRDLEGMLTGSAGPGSVSSQLRDYELLRLREEFAETIYTLSRSTYEQARKKMDKQQLYLAVIVPPFLPEYPLYPRPIIDSALIFAALMIFWGIGSLLAASVYDSLN